LINSIFLSIWASVVTIIVFSIAYTNNTHDPGHDILSVELVDHHTDNISTALFDDGAVIGHFITRVRFRLPINTESLNPVALDLIIKDGLFDVISEMKVDDLIRLEQNDLQSMASRLTHTLGQRKTSLAIKNISFENTRLMLKSY